MTAHFLDPEGRPLKAGDRAAFTIRYEGIVSLQGTTLILDNGSLLHPNGNPGEITLIERVARPINVGDRVRATSSAFSLEERKTQAATVLARFEQGGESWVVLDYRILGHKKPALVRLSEVEHDD